MFVLTSLFVLTNLTLNCTSAIFVEIKLCRDHIDIVSLDLSRLPLEVKKTTTNCGTSYNVSVADTLKVTGDGPYDHVNLHCFCSSDFYFAQLSSVSRLDKW